MSHDDSSWRAPASEVPETDAIDSSWDDPDISVEIEIHDGEEPLEEASIHERVTTVPKYDPEQILESGFHEVEPPTEDMLAPPPAPRFAQPLRTRAAKRAPSGELDDPAEAFRPDLDVETPSEHPLPIEDRVTPVHEPPPSLLELALDSKRTPDDPDASELKQRYAVGDFSGALEIAKKILGHNPDDLDARRYAQSCRDVLVSMYSARLGALDQAVSVALPADQIRWLSLDHRSGFMLSLVDGSSSVEEILDICGMPRLDALQILCALLDQRVIALSPRG